MQKRSLLPLTLVLPLLLILIPLLLGIHCLRQSKFMERWIFERSQALWRIHDDRCSLSGPHLNMTDRLLLQDAFQADFAKKPVYLIGGCVAEELINTGLLSEMNKTKVGIYGMPGYNYNDMKRLLDWFIRDLSFGKS